MSSVSVDNQPFCDTNTGAQKQLIAKREGTV